VSELFIFLHVIMSLTVLPPASFPLLYLSSMEPHQYVVSCQSAHVCVSDTLCGPLHVTCTTDAIVINGAKYEAHGSLITLTTHKPEGPPCVTDLGVAIWDDPVGGTAPNESGDTSVANPRPTVVPRINLHLTTCITLAFQNGKQVSLRSGRVGDVFFVAQ